MPASRTFTPDQLAKRFVKVARAVKDQDKTAIAARAQVTKQIITGVAASTSPMGRKFGRRFVKYDLIGNDTAAVRLRSGFGFLTELGSYKASFSGWDETPKPGGQALRTGYGFFASVQHPPIRRRPFWNAGVAASRKPGQDAYGKVLRNTISDAMR